MAERGGTVWFEDEIVGTLRVDSRGAIHFAYDSHWVRAGFPISVQLPLETGTDEINAHGFFEGLLPEGRSRDRVCRQYRIPEDDDAELLLAIGEDCAGALSILPDGETPVRDEHGPQRLGEPEVADLIRSQGKIAPRDVEQGQHFSLAGAQDKYAVIVDDDGHISLPTRQHPSTHILKFETIPHVCFAETVGLELATSLGLEVVRYQFRRLDDHERTPYLLIERYDRERDATGRIRRLHQEDVIQALGYETRLKYEEHGGPSLADVAVLMRETAHPIPSLQRLMQWQIVNYLIENSDGHGKNLALRYSRGQFTPTLAPFYDVIAIGYLNRLYNSPYSRRMAFYIGGEGSIDRITRPNWEGMARDLGVRPARVIQELATLSHDLPRIVRCIRAALERMTGYSGEHYEQLNHVIATRCAWLLRTLGENVKTRDLLG